MSDNPLSQYFRQPAIYIQLPSNGKFYAPDSLETTPNGEYPVLPMTTVDEITYRTPDALFNGTAVASVIQSCVPNIKNAWGMPASDIDTVLVAIRIATYGHEMDITTKCPACQAESDYGLDLRQVLGQIAAPDYSEVLKKGDLEIHFKPMSYQQLNDNNLAQFEEQKVLQVMENQDLDDAAKQAQLGEILKKITSVTIRALGQSIQAIRTPQTTVVEPEYIAEWLANCDRGLFAQVRDYIINTKRQGEIQPLKIKCRECNHEYEQVFTLDMTSFFEAAS